MSRGGFTLIEVLISVLILFFSGSALLKFNSFIKNQFEEDVKKHRLALVGSVFSGEKRFDKLKEYQLLDFVKINICFVGVFFYCKY